MTSLMRRIAQVAEDMPCVHGEVTWRVADKDLRLIETYVRPESVTAETGAGLSTIMFAIIGSRHTAIAPVPEEWLRIQEACRRHHISTANVTFVPGSSVDVLPKLAPDSFDFCFIDGCHGFPVVALDFFYMSRMLKVGGVLGLDDVPIWACKMVSDFLKHEQGWQYLTVGERAAFFVKRLADQESREWDHQPFNLQQTHKIQRWRSVPDFATSITRRPRRLLKLIREGNFALIRDKLKKR